jgi:hypothetical protein
MVEVSNGGTLEANLVGTYILPGRAYITDLNIHVPESGNFAACYFSNIGLLMVNNTVIGNSALITGVSNGILQGDRYSGHTGENCTIYIYELT